MSIRLGRRIGIGLWIVTIGLLWWQTPTGSLDPWDWSTNIQLGPAVMLTGLGLLAIYLLLRPDVSK